MQSLMLLAAQGVLDGALQGAIIGGIVGALVWVVMQVGRAFQKPGAKKDEPAERSDEKEGG